MRKGSMMNKNREIEKILETVVSEVGGEVSKEDNIESAKIMILNVLQTERQAREKVERELNEYKKGKCNRHNPPKLGCSSCLTECVRLQILEHQLTKSQLTADYIQEKQKFFAAKNVCGS